MPFSSHYDPTEAQLRWQIYTSIAYGARGVMYFCYQTPRGHIFSKGGAILTHDERRAVLLNNYSFAYTAWPTVAFDVPVEQVREVCRETGSEISPVDDSPCRSHSIRRRGGCFCWPSELRVNTHEIEVTKRSCRMIDLDIISAKRVDHGPRQRSG
jgi:hypothetical protein